MMTYEASDEFERDLKHLSKKYPSLQEDLEIAKKGAIELRYVHETDNHASFEIPGYCSETIKIVKIKKFACRSLKGLGVRSGIRIIFAYYPAESRVVFLEMYHKSDQENTNTDRIKNFLGK